MKAFLQRYGYYSIKMFVDQLVLAMFGLVLALVSKKADSMPLLYLTGIASVLFYLFLLYTVGWEMGSKDRISVNAGQLRAGHGIGFAVSLTANALNFLLALFFLARVVFPDSGFCLLLGQIGSTSALLIEGVYTGLLSLSFAGSPLNTYWFMYFLIPLPAVLVSGISYVAGLHDFMLTGIMKQPYPDSDRPQKKG